MLIKRIQDAGAIQMMLTLCLDFYLYGCRTCLLFSMKNAPHLVQQNKLIYEDQLKRALDEDGQRASTYITPQSFYPNGI